MDGKEKCSPEAIEKEIPGYLNRVIRYLQDQKKKQNSQVYDSHLAVDFYLKQKRHDLLLKEGRTIDPALNNDLY